MFRCWILAALLLIGQETQSWRRRLEDAARSDEAWRARRTEIRQRILVSAGLWPEFDRPPLKPVVFGKIERGNYSIEKVRFETWPGFHLTGNLYRPLGKKGPFPAVVSPHGHWRHGRFNDEPAGSVPGRAITLARLGFVVFSYDMVGYGDLTQIPHRFGDPPHMLGLLGLQLWNSLRAVDFLVSLDDVDPKRIGATGASGGGTQTFLLAAVDDRIACAAPVCMVAAEFQGGCPCENAPGLRIDLNNVEIAACTAPRPLLLVSASGDWTARNPDLEAPALRRAYESLGAKDRFRAVQFKAEHNYNKDSREVVYAWLARWLQGAEDRERIEEPEFKVEKREDLAVFAKDHPRPDKALDAAGLADLLKKRIADQLEALKPRDAESLKKFRDVMGIALRHLLSTRWPGAGEFKVEGDLVSRKDWPRPVELRGSGTGRATLFVGVDPKGAEGRVFVLGKTRDDPPPSGGTKEQHGLHQSTYFRTALARRVGDILFALAYIASLPDAGEIRLVGIGEDGVAVLLAAALAPRDFVGRTIVELSDAWKTQPGLLRIGGLKTAALLCDEADLVLHEEAWSMDRVLQELKR